MRRIWYPLREQARRPPKGGRSLSRMTAMPRKAKTKVVTTILRMICVPFRLELGNLGRHAPRCDQCD